ncbi:hypothetical protein Egran_01449 [Elaphomyces granulatus]|uniref:Sterol 3-beta-glucosyltransferase n=1 Tax=Elaphomyces granulatus TaxID=519963 RepID=A0A232M323_9EURO|nr:hypothetical protein Egran_01449 [Elaphomyces granulatus]
MPHLNDSGKKMVGNRPIVSSKSVHSMSSHRLPERFKDGDDAQDDVTAPPKSSRARGGQVQCMQQSIFSIIAAAGSRSGFHARFDDSSESDGDTEKPGGHGSGEISPRLAADSGIEGGDAASHSKQRGEREKCDQRRGSQSPSEEKSTEHRRKLSENRLLRSLPRLPLMNPGSISEPSSRDGSPPASAAWQSGCMTPRAAPVLSRMIEAQTRFGPEASSTENKSLTKKEGPGKRRTLSNPSTLLSTRLMEIFGFEKPEKVIAEYACCLLQNVLLQGYMYVTEGHICFYAYLSQKSNAAVKTGYLAKRGRKNPKYNRYWFSLKGDVLTYFADPSNLYFPSGHVDLRYGITAALVEQKDKEKDAKDFTITTDHRTYYFRAESATSAKEWVKALQKVIFRSHNEGDSIKISLPIENVIDIEESPMIEFAETFKIRVVDSGETYAIDEYFLSFFDFGKDAFETLKDVINTTPAQSLVHEPALNLGRGESGRSSLQHGSPRRSVEKSSHSGPFSETSQTSLGTSLDRGQAVADFLAKANSKLRRKSEGARRMSFEQKDLEQSPHGKHNDSDSFVHSFGPGTESSVIIPQAADTTESASQILNGSEVFQSPTISRLQRVPSDLDGVARRPSQDTARSPSTQARVRAGVSPGLGLEEFSNKREQESQSPVSESDYEVNGRDKAYSTSAPTLQEIVRAGTYPLQRAAGLAEYLRNRSKQMSSLLASESMGYIEKVSGMWAGGGKHYMEGEGILSEDRTVDPDDEERGRSQGDRFRAHFALPSSEKLQATYFGYLHQVLPLYGKIYIGNRKFCFRSLLPGTRTKLILPLKDIENVEKEKGFRFGYHGLVIIIRGHEELFFEFNMSDVRDDCAVTLHQSLESVRFLVESGLLAREDQAEAEAAKAEHRMLQEARLDLPSQDEAPQTHPIFDDPRASILNFKPVESLRITCLTIGSRGDVQPYIALCKGLLAEGHRPRIATHQEFEPWVRKHGIDFAPVEGDPAELMRLCIENGMFTYSFLKEASLKFRGWIDGLLSSAWQSCQDSDVLIESPSAMAGIHIAEALRIPYFRAFTMPWTRTRAYPHAFAVPEHRMGGAYNYITYVMFDTVFWKAIAGQVNRWRKKELGLRGTNLDHMQPNKAPFLYNFSPSVVVPPLDYPDWIRVTGYWFLDEGLDWRPPVELCEFIKRARRDGKKVVYIGFGSIVVSDPTALTKTVVESVRKADVRCILSKGWSDRLGDPTSARPEIPLPFEIHQIVSAPHDWLFRQVDAVAHHGGAGTTGASLRAGTPTIIKPFFGDQFFFGSRVEDLGVGICMKKLNVSVFSRALWEATHSERMIVKARRLGEHIRKENGVSNAIQAIYRDLEYAQTLARQRSAISSTPFTPVGDDDQAMEGDDDLEDIEETWTFVGNDTDLDLSKRVWDPCREREGDAELLCG